MKNILFNLLGVVLMLGLTDSALAKRPNIILILTDDQGWNNTEIPMILSRPDTRSDYYLTPNYKRVADAGMIFSQAYAPHPVCSPSRHAIQFGMTPAKLKKTSNRAVHYPEPFPVHSIPQVLKSIDPAYRAAHFGKWHMHRHPAALGYDASDGRTGNHTARQLSTDQTKFWPHDDPKRSVSLTDNAVQFIRHQAHARAPFYLQVSHYAIHLSAEAKPATLARHKARVPGKVHTAHWYAAMIDDLDHAVGRILDVLDELKLKDNTFVFLTSDNGGTARQYPHFNQPLRAGKGSYYEGGLRVPFFVAGPGIKAGSYSAVPVVGYDLLPTFAILAGLEGKLPEGIEGGSIKSVLFDNGEGVVRRPRAGLHFYRPLNSVLIRDGYKLLHTHRTGQVELYNLAEDLSETTDLASAQPRLIKRMQAALKEWIGAIDAAIPSPLDRRVRRRP
ncbi:MAG: sulfatase-like hydrolase/transferase [Verrucomicrobiota bacterium]|nr:sulfatase-like hydrolase/transferase [Verrucomicrobiota bacterium]